MFIKSIARFNQRILGTGKVRPFNRVTDADEVSDIIYAELQADKPSMVARYGYTELMCIINYLGVTNGRPNLLRYLLGMELDWWWRKSSLSQMAQWSGFFPTSISEIERFCRMMLVDSTQLDILASWLTDERRLHSNIGAYAYIQGLYLDPFWASHPWSRILKDKKVLVVHPFAPLIRQQYEKHREQLFSNTEILPKFFLKVLPAVQSLGGIDNGFKSWFDALEYMEKQIAAIDFDICLIGCGAYGFPLAAYVKRLGKKAVHMGGSLQLLFGIRGQRWENPDYAAEELGEKGRYLSLMNEYWVRPGVEFRPQNAEKVENACYW